MLILIFEFFNKDRYHLYCLIVDWSVWLLVCLPGFLIWVFLFFCLFISLFLSTVCFVFVILEACSGVKITHHKLSFDITVNINILSLSRCLFVCFFPSSFLFFCKKMFQCRLWEKVKEFQFRIEEVKPIYCYCYCQRRDRNDFIRENILMET